MCKDKSAHKIESVILSRILGQFCNLLCKGIRQVQEILQMGCIYIEKNAFTSFIIYQLVLLNNSRLLKQEWNNDFPVFRILVAEILFIILVLLDRPEVHLHRRHN
jgi:hypothetical protein